MSDDHIQKRFVIYTEPGKIPQKKGPFHTREQVEEMITGMAPHHHLDTAYIVAEVTYDHDLWLTAASEFLDLQKHSRE